MKIKQAFAGHSQWLDNHEHSLLHFAVPAAENAPRFQGVVKDPLALRAVLQVLQQVACTDSVFEGPGGRLGKSSSTHLPYKWLQGHKGLAADLEMHRVAKARSDQRAPNSDFLKARARYVEYRRRTLEHTRPLFGPWLSVHPDQLALECLSLDGSTYLRVAMKWSAFEVIGAVSPGTGSVDFSKGLLAELTHLRRYKKTRLTVDSGLAEDPKAEIPPLWEHSWDVADDWLKQLLYLNVAAGSASKEFALDPMDILNLCLQLRRRRDKYRPSALHVIARARESLEFLIEPWGTRFNSVQPYSELEHSAILKIGGRRRLLWLEPLLPFAEDVRLHFHENLEPVFLSCDLGDYQVSLGFAPLPLKESAGIALQEIRASRSVDEFLRLRVLKVVRESESLSADLLCARVDLPHDDIFVALKESIGCGQLSYDLADKNFRKRDLSTPAFPPGWYRQGNFRQERAQALLAAGQVLIEAAVEREGCWHLNGTVTEQTIAFQPDLVLDADHRLLAGSCFCEQYTRHKLSKGPCTHILAVQLLHAQQSINR